MSTRALIFETRPVAKFGRRSTNFPDKVREQCSNASSNDDLSKSGNEAAACERMRISNVIHRNLGGAEREVNRLVIALVCRLPNAHTG